MQILRNETSFYILCYCLKNARLRRSKKMQMQYTHILDTILQMSSYI